MSRRPVSLLVFNAGMTGYRLTLPQSERAVHGQVHVPPPCVVEGRLVVRPRRQPDAGHHAAALANET